MASSVLFEMRGWLRARAGARPDDVVQVRRSTGKRPYEVVHPEVWPALERLLEPVTRGDPESPLRWTCKSTHVLSVELFSQQGIRSSDKTVAKLLRKHNYSLQAPNKSVEGTQHLDRNAQFEHINATPRTASSAAFRSSPSMRRRRNWWGTSRTGGVSGTRRASPNW